MAQPPTPEETYYAWAGKIQEYALAHYNDRGVRWDVIVECWSHDEMVEHMQEFPPRTYGEAFELFKGIARAQWEQYLNQTCDM